MGRAIMIKNVFWSLDMKIFAILISIIAIVGGQFAKYRYDSSKQTANNNFFRSQFFWSVLYEIGIIFLGAILAILLTEASTLKFEQTHTIGALEQISQALSFETSNMDHFVSSAETSDEDYNENTRYAIHVSITNNCDVVENIISQSNIQDNLSTKSYVRFMGIISRLRIYANEILITDNPSYIYNQVKSEYDSLINCIDLEIEFINGTRTEKELGDWICKTISFSE